MNQEVKTLKSVLLMSSSRKGHLGYLEHATDQIHALLKHGKQTILFIPYAGVTFSYDSYEAMVKPVFESLGYQLKSIHHFADPIAAVKNAQVIAVGGGNTFALLRRMYDAKIVDLITERVNAGVPYIGWSAGSNVACPSIRTTNDMPIIEPPSLKSLGLIPFQINPHFISGKPVGHNGESREERLAEFLCINPTEELVALPEGTALLVNDDTAMILGEFDALHLKQAVDNKEVVEKLITGKSFKLSMIKGVFN
ncbi:dipeptidase E [Gammaproteobacteria bacterium]|nr:dipeptidase E [Gammaproteobacteria bacterium]